MKSVRYALLPILAALLSIASWNEAARAVSVPFPNEPEAGWAVDGPVRSVRVANGVALIGGDFTQAMGSNGTFPRAGFAAFKLSDSSVTPLRADVDGSILAIETDASSIFLGGSFTTVSGVSRSGLAELDATTAAVKPDLNLTAGSKVNSLALSNDRLYVGGGFSKIGGVGQAYAAAVRLADRTIDPGFAPSLNGKVRALRVSTDGSSIVVGGPFTEVGGSSHPHLARLGRDGAVDPVSYNIPQGWPVLSLAINADATEIYAGSGGVGNTLYAFDSGAADARWSHKADGDIQAVGYYGGNVYFGFHDGFPTLVDVRVLAVDAATGRLETDFRPNFRGFWGTRALDVDSQGLVIGGEFDSVNGVSLRNVAFFNTSRGDAVAGGPAVGGGTANPPSANPGGGTSGPPTAQPGKQSKVKAKAVRRGSAVKAKVRPKLSGQQWRIVVQRATKKQRMVKWRKIGRYVTRGAGHVKIVDVRKGSYRVKVPKQKGYAASLSKVVRIKR